MDLYIPDVFYGNHNKCLLKYQFWVFKRDKFREAGRHEEAERIQKQANKYLYKMYGHAVLWIFNMNWWKDFSDFLMDEKGTMDPSRARDFLVILKKNEPIFEDKLKKTKTPKGVTRGDFEKYFKDRYRHLKAFLQEAIDNNEDIEL